jgi:hypothetical protein
MPSDLKDPLTSCTHSQRDKNLSSQQCHRKESSRKISKRSVPYLFWIEEKVSAHPNIVVRRFSRRRFTLAVRPEDSSLLTASSRISEHPTVNRHPAPCRISVSILRYSDGTPYPLQPVLASGTLSQLDNCVGCDRSTWKYACRLGMSLRLLCHPTASSTDCLLSSTSLYSFCGPATFIRQRSLQPFV